MMMCHDPPSSSVLRSPDYFLENDESTRKNILKIPDSLETIEEKPS